GVVGQEPGSSGEPVPAALHGPIRLGNRVYFGYGTSAGGILQIVDRDKLLQGDPTSPHPFAPTAHNILYAQIGRLDTSPHVGAHASTESFTPIYYGRLVFISYFNAGVRAVDIRNPYRPQEVAFYIPAITEKTDRRCVPATGGGETCKITVQTNNVEVDDRGYI